MNEPAVNSDFNKNRHNAFPNRLIHTSNGSTPAAVLQTKLANGDKFFICLTAISIKQKEGISSLIQKKEG